MHGWVSLARSHRAHTTSQAGFHIDVLRVAILFLGALDVSDVTGLTSLPIAGHLAGCRSSVKLLNA